MIAAARWTMAAALAGHLCFPARLGGLGGTIGGIEIVAIGLNDLDQRLAAIGVSIGLRLAAAALAPLSGDRLEVKAVIGGRR